MTNPTQYSPQDIGLALRMFEKDSINDCATVLDSIWGSHSTDGYAAVQQFFGRNEVANSRGLLNLAFALKPLKYGLQILKKCCNPILTTIVAGNGWVQIYVNDPVVALLCAKAPVNKGSWDWAKFGSGKGNHDGSARKIDKTCLGSIKTNLQIVPGDGLHFLIRSSYGEPSYLVAKDPTENRVGDSFTDHYAIFTTYKPDALRASISLEAIDGGVTWNVRAKYWADTWLRPHEGAVVAKDSYQWASFTRHDGALSGLTLGPPMMFPAPR